MNAAEKIARYYGQGKEVRNRDGWLTLCVIHQESHPSLSVTDTEDGDVKVHCHVGCDFKEIKDRFRADGLLPEWKPSSEKNGKKQAPPTPEKKDHPPEPEKPSYVWKKSSREGIEHGQQYLANRGIFLDPMPLCFKWNSYKDETMLVCAVTSPEDTQVYAVHRLPVDIDTHLKSSKGKLLGLTDGRGIWFDRKGDMKTLIIGEGPETTLSAMQVMKMNGVSAISANFLEHIILPDDTEVIYILVDSDRNEEPKKMTGQKAAYALAERFTESREGRVAYLVSPDDSCFSDTPAYLDFNDLLQADPTGENIRQRFAVAVRFQDLEWRPQGGDAEHDKDGKKDDLPFLVVESDQGKRSLVAQSGAAQRIGLMIQGVYAFSIEASLWHQFDQNFWRACSTLEVESAVTDRIYEGAGGIGFSSTYARGVMEFLRKNKALALPPQQHGCIPFQNGLFDIKTMKLLEITPSNAQAWTLSFNYIPDADCPEFRKWLEAAVDGDQGTVMLLRAFLNAVLVGRPELQKFLSLLGPAGTGKSTFVRLVCQMIGKSNCTTTTLKQLEVNRFETANIYGKRLVIIEETGKYGGNTSVFKSMTGQDPLRLERKNQQQRENFVYEGQVIVTGNERSSTNDNSNGLERRRVEVSFTHCITPEERTAWNQRGGEEGILWPEIPGIINWALQLPDDEVRSAFQVMPDRVRRANLEAARFDNSLLDWMLDNLLPDESASTQIGIKVEIRVDGEIHYDHEDDWLYPNYLQWCQGHGRMPVSLRSFSDVMIEQARTYGTVLRKERLMQGTMIRGARIKKPAERSWFFVLEMGEHVGSADPCRVNEGSMKDKHLELLDMKDKAPLNLSHIYKEPTYALEF